MHLLTVKVIRVANFNIKAFKKLTNEDLRKIIQNNNKDHTDWINGRMTKTAFEDNQMHRGWNWNPADIVLNRRFHLDLPTVVMFDWAH